MTLDVQGGEGCQDSLVCPLDFAVDGTGKREEGDTEAEGNQGHEGGLEAEELVGGVMRHC